MTESCKKIRNREILLNGTLAVILFGLGYWLAFSNKRPVDTILKESLVVDAQNYVFTVCPPFFWGSLVVAAGCVMITCGAVNLITMLANLKYAFLGRRTLKLFEEISHSFRYVFRSLLLLLLYITSWDTFEDLANHYFRLMNRDFGYFNPMIFQKPVYYFILLMVFVVGIWCLRQIAVDEFNYGVWLNRLAGVLGIASLVGLILNVSINWWYLLVCLGAIIVYLIIERLIKLKMDKNYEGLVVLLEELDFKL